MGIDENKGEATLKREDEAVSVLDQHLEAQPTRSQNNLNIKHIYHNMK